MIDIIYKTVKPSHVKKLQIIQNIKNQMLQFIFIYSDWNLIKQIIVSSIPFRCWGKQIFERMLPGGMSNFLLPRAWWEELGGKKGVSQKKRGKFWKLFCLGGGKWLTLGKEGFAWGTRGTGKLYRLTIKCTSSKIVVKDFPYTLRVPSTDCFNSIASQKKTKKQKQKHIFQELALLWNTIQCHET